jgi:energy-converting hydrogenase Eha subunit C
MLQINLSIWMDLSKSPMTKIISCISLESSAIAAMLHCSCNDYAIASCGPTAECGAKTRYVLDIRV